MDNIEQQEKETLSSNNNDLLKSYDSMMNDSTIITRNEEQPEQEQEQEQEESNELNEDDYDILNKNDELSTQLNEISERISLEEVNSEETERVLDILGNGTLVKKVLKKGGDADKRPKNGQICTISYELRLADADEVIENNQGFEFVLGDGDVVPALDIAVSLMDLNEECELTTDARHAYDHQKSHQMQKLVYKITLDKFEYSPELNKLETIERLSLADSKKQRGNYHYNRQSYEQAVASYRKGLKYFLDYNLNGTESKEDLEKFTEVKVALNMNVALSNYKLQSHTDALEALDNVLKHQPKHVKALFIKGKILVHVGEVEESIKFFNRALEIDEKNADIAKELARAQAKYKVQYAKEKEMYQKMISGVGATPESTNTSPSSSKANTSAKKKKSSNNSSYNTLNSILTTAGVVVAIASIGFAAYAKYKNLI